MTSFTFSLEQVHSAPPEVRRWIENEIAAALGSLTRSEHGPSEPHSVELAACTPEEALKIFELIKGNFLLSQVFFELARDAATHRRLGAVPYPEHWRTIATYAACGRGSPRRLLYRD